MIEGGGDKDEEERDCNKCSCAFCFLGSKREREKD